MSDYDALIKRLLGTDSFRALHKEAALTIHHVVSERDSWRYRAETAEHALTAHKQVTLPYDSTADQLADAICDHFKAMG